MFLVLCTQGIRTVLPPLALGLHARLFCCLRLNDRRLCSLLMWRLSLANRHHTVCFAVSARRADTVLGPRDIPRPRQLGPVCGVVVEQYIAHAVAGKFGNI